MELIDALLESWDRQAQIVNHVAKLVTEETRGLLPSPDGMRLDKQLAHIDDVRYSWLSQFAPKHVENLRPKVEMFGNGPVGSLDEVRDDLTRSAAAIRAAVAEALGQAEYPKNPYDTPVLFLQHMVWHDGWHVGLIFLGLRLGGFEPSEEWEETNVWGLWRTE